LGGKLKLSIHERGEIHYSVQGEVARALGKRNQQRHIDKWQLSHTIPLFKIVVPYSELRVKQDIEKGEIHYLPPPTNHSAVEIYLYITSQSLKDIMPEQFSIFLEKNLANGNTLSLIWRNNPITKNNNELNVTNKQKLKQIIHQRKITGKDLRGYLFINNEGKERGFIDLAL